MLKKLKPSPSKLAPLWISIVILPGILGSLPFINRCGSTKVSMGADGWTIEASGCPVPMTHQDQPRTDR